MFAIGLHVGPGAVAADLDRAILGPLVDRGHADRPSIGPQLADDADSEQFRHGSILNGQDWCPMRTPPPEKPRLLVADGRYHRSMPSVRVPQQSRSRALVARVLQAAGELFASEGFDRTTTNGIAAAAGVSVGSLYQFFVDKEAIFDALQAEWSQRLTAELDVSLIDDGRPLVEIVDDVLEVHARLDREQPGLLAVLLTRTGSRHTRSARGAIQARLEQLLERGAPGMSESQRRVAAAMLNHITLGLYTVPRSIDPDRTGARAEVRRTLIAYLRAVQNGELG